ncbi:hypothetical protein LZ198_21680 [Myxococcus sp. K15C18031901]|uniref:hypothetical protein n=1 Tax=Myxococcus dinghuensis TaxID=2906761 RepID=UPI0020A7FF89|nr:hypothetical protein [Myxococcus dinghuensis]MCP3101490.1 hypothetical protein [Myxococcus dinghuensis]
MKASSQLRVVGLAVGLSVAALFGCGEDGEASHRRQSVTNEDTVACAMTDATDPVVARRLEGATLTAMGAPTVREVNGKRVSSLDVRVDFPRASAGGTAAQGSGRGKVQCSGSCSGAICDPPRGCDPTATGCTQLYCSVGCNSTCTKTMEYDPDGGTDAGTADAGSSDAGASDAGASRLE